MSTGALLLAVRDRLRDTLDQTPHLNNKSSIDIMPDSKPKADCGQTFLSIYSESWSNPNTQAQGALEERMDVVVAISQRTPETPQDPPEATSRAPRDTPRGSQEDPRGL